MATEELRRRMAELMVGYGQRAVVVTLLEFLGQPENSEVYAPDNEVAMHSADVFDPHYMSFALHDLPQPASRQAERILDHEGPLWQALNKFLRRNAEYGEAANVLGVKGQFADINRKVIKLKRFMWDDEPLPDGAESVHTIVCELIGHLLLVLDEMNMADRRDKQRDADRGPNYEMGSD